MAVLDELWQMKPTFDDIHVDQNWYEYGDLEYRMTIDTELAAACIEGSKEIGISSKGVNYDKFPIDTGTIVANGFLNPGGRMPLTIASNNLYHSFDETVATGEMAVEKARRLNRRVALVGVGGLSGSIFRHEIDIATDGIATAEDDEWNRKMLARIQQGGSVRSWATFARNTRRHAKADMGFKHFAWILGGLGRRINRRTDPCLRRHLRLRRGGDRIQGLTTYANQKATGEDMNVIETWRGGGARSMRAGAAAAQDCTVTVGRVVPMTGPLLDMGRETPWVDEHKMAQLRTASWNRRPDVHDRVRDLRLEGHRRRLGRGRAAARSSTTRSMC